jgi:hypothetical protein
MTVVRSHRTRAGRAWCVLLACFGALLVGCHSRTLFTPGTPVLTMGDTVNSSDFAGYVVNIEGMTLTDKDGNVVTLLGATETVDLVRLNHLSELVEAPAVPAATYVSATVTVDYTYGIISPIVNGQPVSATTAAANAMTATAYTVPVTFDPAYPLVITNQKSTRLQLDIDLAASDSINTSTSPATVTVQPFVTLSVTPADSTVLRARGLFVTTQSVASGFYMNMRPFYDQVSALGAVVVNTNDKTYFNVNGVTYTGAAGLSALTALPVDTPLAAYGTLESLAGITPTFNATAVYGGTSLENPVAEFLSGTVSSRSGSTFNLRGVTYLPPPVITYPPIVNGAAVTTAFYANVPVTLGSSTMVTEDGVAAGGLSPDSISVGQEITVSGQANINRSTGQPLSLDATAGQVRLTSTPLWGMLNSASAGAASLDLLALGNFAASTLDFAGTGTSTATDATASSYQVATGSLNESAVPAGTLLQMNGIVAPFGSGPPDFSATSVTPGTATLQQLVIEWSNAAEATAPFTSLSSTGLVVNVANTALGSLHSIRTGPTAYSTNSCSPPACVDITSLPTSPAFKITTVGANQSTLVLAVGSAALTTGVSVFNTAAGFASGLHTALNGTNRVFRLVAYGQYDSSTNSFIASRIYVALQETT